MQPRLDLLRHIADDLLLERRADPVAMPELEDIPELDRIVEELDPAQLELAEDIFDLGQVILEILAQVVAEQIELPLDIVERREVLLKRVEAQLDGAQIMDFGHVGFSLFACRRTGLMPLAS